MIKFNKHHVTNGATKARCFYSVDNRVDGRKCVTIYGKDYSRDLHCLFADAANNTDTMTDYFVNSHVVLFADHHLYAAARQRAEAA